MITELPADAPRFFQEGARFKTTKRLIFVKYPYEDDEEGRWIADGDPFIDDIEQGSPLIMDTVKKGSILTIRYYSEENADKYWFPSSGCSLMVDCHDKEKIVFCGEFGMDCWMAPVKGGPNVQRGKKKGGIGGVVS